jgi:hypothetical protein
MGDGEMASRGPDTSSETSIIRALIPIAELGGAETLELLGTVPTMTPDPASSTVWPGSFGDALEAKAVAQDLLHLASSTRLYLFV